MRIAFHKTGAGHDRVYVNRADGSELAWRWPAGGPPHDLMHYAVETELELAGGFWGLVAGGANFNYAAAHAEIDPATRTLTEVEAEGLGRAENVVNAVTGAVTIDEYPIEGAVATAATSRPEFDRACRAARRWLGRWRGLHDGETLVVEWPD